MEKDKEKEGEVSLLVGGHILAGSHEFISLLRQI